MSVSVYVYSKILLLCVALPTSAYSKVAKDPVFFPCPSYYYSIREKEQHTTRQYPVRILELLGESLPHYTNIAV